MHRDILPFDRVEDSLEAHLNRHSRRSQAIYIAALILITVSMAMLPFVRVGVSVQSEGIIRPITEKHEVSARTSGFAELVAIDEHQHVERDQEIVRLRTAPVDVRRGLIGTQIEDIRARLQDLDLLVQSSESPLRPERFRTAEYRQEYLRYADELAALSLKEGQAEREFVRAKELTEQNLLPRMEADDREFQLASLRAERVSIVQRYRSSWTAALAGLRLELQELLSQSDQLEEESALFSIRSPVTGTVENLASISSGSWVQAGQQLAVISPTTDLVAEIYVSPRDIGLLGVGTPVRLMIDAFNYSDWSFLTGAVTEISDDYLLVNQEPMFRVVVDLDRQHLTLANGFRGEIRKGMTLRARFMVAERTLWQLLRDDLNDWLNPTHAAS